MAVGYGSSLAEGETSPKGKARCLGGSVRKSLPGLTRTSSVRLCAAASCDRVGALKCRRRFCEASVAGGLSVGGGGNAATAGAGFIVETGATAGVAAGTGANATDVPLTDGGGGGAG